jgi:phosphoribosylanthranilate isomerase
VDTQIYCRRPSLGEVQALIEIGVTHIAWDVSPQDGNGLVLSAQIAEMVRAASRKSTLLVHSRKVTALATIARMVKPDYLLLSSDRDDSEMPGLAATIGSHSKLMMSVPVRQQGSAAEIPSLERAREYALYAGALTVDTCVDPSRPTIFGCTGRTNDWSVCAAIVRTVQIPVVLAGGLDARNVGAAIKAVRPAIVDACTSVELSDKSKDLKRCAAFVAAASAAPSHS